MNHKVPVLLSVGLIVALAAFIIVVVAEQSASIPQSQVSVAKKSTDIQPPIKLAPVMEGDDEGVSETKPGPETGKVTKSQLYKDLGITVEVVKGNLVSNSCFGENEFTYESILRLVYTDGSIENVDTEQCSSFSFFSLAPKGELLFFVKSGYESGSSHIWDRMSKKDLLEGRSDISIDSEQDIYWSLNNSNFAVVSGFNEGDGSGTNGVFIGKINEAISLKLIFSFSDDTHINDSQISEVTFLDQNNLFFVAEYKTSEDEVEKKVEYKYSFITDKLEEVK